MKYTIVLTILVTTLSCVLGAEGIELSGEHRAYLSCPIAPDHDNLNGPIKAPRLENDLIIIGEHAPVTLHTGVRLTERIDPSDNQNVRLIPLENYLSLNTGKVQTSLGFQEFFWGSADKINPVDNINPRDYTTGPDAEKLPIFAASVKVYPVDRLSIETVFAPFDQSDIVPANVADRIPAILFDRLRLQSVALSQSGLVIIPEQVAGTKKLTVNEPPLDLTSSLAGVRFKLMNNTLDIAASYIYDLDQFYTPEIALEQYSIIDSYTSIVPPLTREIAAASGRTYAYGLKKITLERRRIHRVGLDAKAVVDRFGIWGEVCYSITDKNKDRPYESRGDQIAWTLGCDFMYGPSDEHYVNIQQIGRYIRDFDSDFGTHYPGMRPSASDMTDEDAMLRFYYRMLTNRVALETEELLTGVALRHEWSFLDGNCKPILEGIYVYPFHYDKSSVKRYGDFIGSARIEWKPADAVVIGFGGEGYYSICKEHGSNDISNLYDNKTGIYFPDSRVFVKGTFNWSK
jgi:hypothetical protein